MVGSKIEQAFPSLNNLNYKLTSPETRSYNCIAWAAGDSSRKWWPDKSNIAYWPAGIPREETIDTFIAAYKTLDYIGCENGEWEQGFEKIAIYAKYGTEPTHAALQLENGEWTSKLGDSHDISHKTAEIIEGKCYGNVVCYLKRKRNPNNSLGNKL